jgi:hypothetical protein
VKSTNFSCDILISAGDEFDEADFSVNNSEHPDEVTLDNAMTSEHSKRRGSLPKNCQPPTAAKAVVSNQQADRQQHVFSRLRQCKAHRLLPTLAMPTVFRRKAV